MNNQGLVLLVAWSELAILVGVLVWLILRRT
jgi:hypothetical protein